MIPRSLTACRRQRKSEDPKSQIVAQAADNDLIICALPGHEGERRAIRYQERGIGWVSRKWIHRTMP